jgi:hypothetical protein
MNAQRRNIEAMVVQYWFLFAPLSSYKKFRSAANMLPSCKSARHFCAILTKSVVSQQNFAKVPNIKFQENPSSGSRADMCGPTDGRTNMTKLVDAFPYLRDRV